MIELSASVTPRARECPPSIRTEGLQVVTGDIPAAGLALHYILLTGIANHQHLEVADVAAMFKCDPEELERLAIQGWRAWSAIRQWFGEHPQCEWFLQKEFNPPGLKLSGHVDVLGLAPAQRQIRLLDWKSSWQDEDASDQIRAYALLALANYPDYDEVWAAVIRPRQGTYDARVYRRDELFKWLDGLVERLTGRGSEQYHPSAKVCGRCPRTTICEAHSKELSKYVQIMTQEKDPVLVDPLAMQEALERARWLKRACERAEDVIKARVIAEGGEFGNLVVTEQARETIRATRQAIDLITNEINVDDWEDISKISKTELKKVIMRDAVYGQRGARWEAVQDQLREAGAVETTVFTKLELRRCKDEPGESLLSGDPQSGESRQ